MEKNSIVITHCPSCGSVLSWKGVDMVCTSVVCPDRDALVLEHFLTTLGCENVTATTLKKIDVYSISDLYDLDEFEIASLDGFGIKRAQQIIFEINKTLKTTPAKLLASFGMTGIGNSQSQNILKVYDFDQIWNLKVSDLMKVDGIGEVLAQNFVDQIHNYVSVYANLVDRGMSWATTSNSLRGKVFCLTGNGEVKRDVLVKMIESNGGYVKQFSKKIDFLVTDDINSSSGKTKKSKEAGIPIILYEQLMEMLK